MNRQISPFVLFLFTESNAHELLQCAVDYEATGGGDDYAEQGADQLRHEGDAAHAAEGLQAKDAGGDAAPGTAQAVQRPDTEYVIDLPLVLRQGEGPDEQAAGDEAGDQCAQRVHQIGTGAHRDQTGERAVVDEAGVVLTDEQRGEDTADHCHQGVDGNQAGDPLYALCRHHVKAEPADGEDPGAQRQEGDV